ncbi:hypothetical protein [Bacillus sp. AFS002410]|nr:hypothetical protein [Bacillus sp. AFS002410]
MKEKKQIHLYLPVWVHEQLKDEAVKNGSNFAPYVTMLLAKYCNDNK